jgi:hypothetical protein
MLSDYRALNYGMIREKLIERKWMEEAVMTQFDILSQKFIGGTEENKKKKTLVKIAGLQDEV